MTNTSIGVQELRTRIGQKAKAEPNHRFWGLYTHVWKLDTLREAYRLTKQNNGAPGVDGVTFKQVEADGAEVLLAAISRELRDGTYRPLPCRQVEIPKDGGKVRVLRIPAIRDRIVQAAVLLIMQPIFETDFQEGSYGYRPGRSAHQALQCIRDGLFERMHQVIDLDLKSYFDRVRHDLLLTKLAQRVEDRDLLSLCKAILKAGGDRGLPQGSVIGPLWANVFLNDIDKMLERARQVTMRGSRDTIRYARFADDLVVLVRKNPSNRDWSAVVERRLREELARLDLEVNEEKSKVFEFRKGTPLNFLGYTLSLVPQRGRPGRHVVLCRPQRKKRTGFLREVTERLNRALHLPVREAVQNVVNPMVRGWVGYFRWGNSSQDLQFVARHVEHKVRRFATRQRPKRRGGRRWTTWSEQEIYGDWGLHSDYRVRPAASPRRTA